MNEDKVKRMQELIARLNEASEAYYGSKDEIMSNYEWDAMFDQIIDKDLGMYKICPECGEAAPSDLEECPNCGARLPEHTAAVKICPHCGAENKALDFYCTNCGKEFSLS